MFLRWERHGYLLQAENAPICLTTVVLSCHHVRGSAADLLLNVKDNILLRAPNCIDISWLQRIIFTFKVFLRTDKSHEGLFSLFSVTKVGGKNVFFFGNSRNRLKYSKQFFVSCNRYVKGLKKIYLFQDTVKTIWNTSNYYILISIQRRQGLTCQS